MTLDTGIAAPLAAALSAKGYDALTAVQSAVLVPELAGRDLLVSAQTGSGKTVAFGLAIAPELLAEGLNHAVAPRALIIAPTRELALQVRREFEWLYAGTGAQVASCVGGMDYRTEKRALDRGAAIVVGTPGRLRDHIERRSLDLSALRAAVLDEADEMLDLGFRDDLEFILGQAPADRRTLMFSATVPKAIEELARDFQRDAKRVVAGGEARQHVDIEYRAMSVAMRDKENAILNLLRLQEAQVSIVFCKTRAAVSHLMARMANRGLPVVALSGELSQQERTHALQALRDGRARVCIATDVAARGIDLPGLELVIHADLPSNSETLLHRSGRTGRAGSKGVSVLIVAPADYRKAQRLLQGAKVVAEWVSPPNADEVQAADDARLISNEVFVAPVTEDEAAMVEALMGAHSVDALAAGILRMWRAGRSAPEVLQDVQSPDAPKRERAERGEFGPSVWFAVSVGRSGRAEARWLLPKICDAGGITRDSIGAIRVQEDQTFVQIAETVAGKFPAVSDIESGVTLTRLAGEPSLDRPERAPRKTSDRAASDRPAAKPRPAWGPDETEAAPAPRKPRVAREDRPAYVPRPAFVDDHEEPAAPVAAADAPVRAYKPRAAAEDRKPYAPRDDAKPYKPRSADAKPYAPRAAAEGKPYKPRTTEAKPYAPRAAAEERKPYAPRAAAADGAKPYKPRATGDGPKKPYAPREDGPRKPYAAREDGPKKPYTPRDADAPRKPRAAGGKPWEGRDSGADSRPARPKTGYPKRTEAPAAPKPNFSDPSQSLRKPRSTGKPAPKGQAPKRG